MGEKRSRERIEILGALSGAATVVQPITIKELSTGGGQIETRFPLHVDSLHEFRLSLGDRSVVVKGRITHCRIADVDQEGVVYRAGIEFIEPPDRAAIVLTEFIEDLKTARRG
jgi:hypothetical protein